MKARILNFRSGESHFPWRHTVKELMQDSLEQANRRRRDGIDCATGLHIGKNVESRTEINECVDLTRKGVQHTHSCGPCVEIEIPATDTELTDAATLHYYFARRGAAAEEAAQS